MSLAKDQGDLLSIATIEYFLVYTAKNLTDLALIFLPMGGIYLTSTVLIELEWAFED